MPRFQVKENARYLGETWGGYFTVVTEDYSWAKKQMEFRFMSYLHKYKSVQPKVSIGRMACKLTMTDGDFIEVLIEDLDKGGGSNEISSKDTQVGNQRPGQ